MANAAIEPDDSTPWHNELRDILRLMPEAQREMLLIRFVDSMNLSEIAASLGVPTGTVKSRLYYAVRVSKRSPRVRQH